MTSRQAEEGGGYVLLFASRPGVEKLLSWCSGLYIEREYQGLSLSRPFVQPHPALRDLMPPRISNSARQVMSTQKLLTLYQLNRKCISLEICLSIIVLYILTM